MSQLNARLAITASVAIFAIAVVGCNSNKRAGAGNKGDSGSSVVSVTTVTATVESMKRTVELPAAIMGYQTTDIYSKVGGFVKELKVDIGAVVSHNDELAILSMPEIEKQVMQKNRLVEQAESQLVQAIAGQKEAVANMESVKAAFEEAQEERNEQKAMLDFQQLEYDRMKDLVARDSVRKELLDSAQLKLDSAKAATQSVEARVRTAAAKLRSAEVSVERSDADAAAAQANRQVAEANRDYVLEMQKYGTITAPYDGEITERKFDIGAFIQPAEGNSAAKPIFQIVQTDKMRVVIEVPMSYVQYLDIGDKAVLSNLDGLSGQNYEATVSRFSAGVNESSRMLTVEIDYKNPDRKLRPGFFGYAEITLEEYNGLPVIPSAAIVKQDDKHFVFVANGGQVSKQEVTVKFDNGTNSAISSGINAGDAIVVSGTNELKDNQSVEANMAEE